MRFEIILAPEALEDLKDFSPRHQAQIKSAIEVHLRHEPTKVSKSRIKRLRGLSKPQFRLRVNDFRIYYDVLESAVYVLAIVSKEESKKWLEKFGEI
jgi:mRNA interferase RelE/StbE